MVVELLNAQHTRDITGIAWKEIINQMILQFIETFKDPIR